MKPYGIIESSAEVPIKNSLKSEGRGVELPSINETSNVNSIIKYMLPLIPLALNNSMSRCENCNNKSFNFQSMEECPHTSIDSKGYC